jgi:hypothetical protein
MTATFTGHELAALRLREVKVSPARVIVRLLVRFRPLHTKLMWDHSTDPIHETGDWSPEPVSGEGELRMIFVPATDRIGGVAFSGFAFHYEYRSAGTPLFYLYDMSSWELDGDIRGATAISQSSCSDPVVTFRPGTAWTTEGIIPWYDANSRANRIMTHNLPRWASHQAFDYQFKGDKTLIGLWERVDLIRSVVRRDAGRPELKVFDKYVFDETLKHATPAKRILLNTEPRSRVGQQNLWTWTIQEVHNRARAEFGLREEPLLQRLNVNYWHSFTIDTYYKDLLPAAEAIGVQALFIDNLCRSNMTARMPFGNMCCSHDFEIATELGGPAKLKKFVNRCRTLGVTPYSWTNPNQSCASPLFRGYGKWAGINTRSWFVRLPDTRSPYCGAYIPEGSDFDLSVEAARSYWTGCLKRIKRQTGLSAYLWDSFYNSAFMPVSYADGVPHTVWRGVLAALKDLQDAGLHFMIESFGPWGEVQHGCLKSYNLDNLFACYKILLGTGYTTIPSGHAEARPAPYPVPDYYRILAHMSKPDLPLFFGNQRIDAVFGAGHRRALADYNANRRRMSRRFLQEDGRSVLWHDDAGRRATLWNFTTRRLALPGWVTDLTTGEKLSKTAGVCPLEAGHTYAIAGVQPLPEALE